MLKFPYKRGTVQKEFAFISILAQTLVCSAPSDEEYRCTLGMDHGGNRDLDRMMNDVAIAYGNDPDQWPGMRAYKYWIDGFRDRAKRRLTGDWIIFAKHEHQNYYLDLAGHEEGQHPEWLYRRLWRGSAAEFPFLFEK